MLVQDTEFVVLLQRPQEAKSGVNLCRTKWLPHLVVSKSAAPPHPASSQVSLHTAHPDFTFD